MLTSYVVIFDKCFDVEAVIALGIAGQERQEYLSIAMEADNCWSISMQVYRNTVLIRFSQNGQISNQSFDEVKHEEI